MWLGATSQAEVIQMAASVSSIVKNENFAGTKLEKKTKTSGTKKKRKIKKTAILAIIGPRDPENRVRDAFLRRLVDGELRRMIFKRFYANLRKKVVRKTFRFTTIFFFLWMDLQLKT